MSFLFKQSWGDRAPGKVVVEDKKVSSTLRIKTELAEFFIVTNALPMMKKDSPESMAP